MLQGYLVVAQQRSLAEELHREMGDDFRMIPLQAVGQLADEPQERVAAVVIRMSPEMATADDSYPSRPAVSFGELTLEAQVDEVERRIIETSLLRHNHRRKETAEQLGISRVTLYNKMKKFGML